MRQNRLQRHQWHRGQGVSHDNKAWLRTACYHQPAFHLLSWSTKLFFLFCGGAIPVKKKKVLVLIYDWKRAIQNGHCFFRLSRCLMNKSAACWRRRELPNVDKPFIAVMQFSFTNCSTRSGWIGYLLPGPPLRGQTKLLRTSKSSSLVLALCNNLLHFCLPPCSSGTPSVSRFSRLAGWHGSIPPWDICCLKMEAKCGR